MSENTLNTKTSKKCENQVISSDSVNNSTDESLLKSKNVNINTIVQNSNTITNTTIKPKRFIAFRIFCAGAISGCISRTLTAPLDRIKVLMQADLGGANYTIKQANLKIWREGGVKAYFKGNGVNCLKVTPENAIKLYFYEYFRKLFNINTDKPELFQRFLIGAGSGFMAQLAVYPLEIAKTRMSLSGPGVYTGMFDVFKKALQYEGPLSFYKGLLASLLGMVPYAGVELSVYSLLKDQYTSHYHDSIPPVWVLLTISGTSSICGQAFSYPLQLVRTRLQAQGMRGVYLESHDRYTGIIDCLLKTVKRNGILGLYKGIGANCLKTIPAISINYTVYEESKRLLGVGDKMQSS